MTFEWPDHPSSPDGDNEHLFLLLADAQPELAKRLIRHFAERWFVAAHLARDSGRDGDCRAQGGARSRVRRFLPAAPLLLHGEYVLAARLGWFRSDRARVHGRDGRTAGCQCQRRPPARTDPVGSRAAEAV